MTMSSERQTATIYDFTARLRAVGRGSRPTAKPDAPAIQAPVVEYGSGWYHDAAIQEPARTPRQ